MICDAVEFGRLAALLCGTVETIVEVLVLVEELVEVPVFVEELVEVPVPVDCTFVLPIKVLRPSEEETGFAG